MLGVEASRYPRDHMEAAARLLLDNLSRTLDAAFRDVGGAAVDFETHERLLMKLERLDAELGDVLREPGLGGEELRERLLGVEARLAMLMAEAWVRRKPSNEDVRAREERV